MPDTSEVARPARKRVKIKLKVRVRTRVPGYKVVEYYGYKTDPPNWSHIGFAALAVFVLVVALLRLA